MPSSPLPSQTFVELPLVCKPQNKWEAKSEGSQRNAAMARLPYHPSYLSELMFPRSPKYWHCLQMEYCHCTNRISKWSKGICKMIILWPPSWPTFPTFPTFSTTFHTFIIHSSCIHHAFFSLVIFSSLGHSTPLCRSDVPSHPSWNSRKWSPRNVRSTDRLPL